ncbi:zinc finger protein 804B isoform X1 [Amblyraja radiata]|uniref:zinc finger protein 804B isoform X1 n=1 Tax=Amblyraja radiata TaxID=386614 RepID=UPI001402FB0A|nr:zinc finger protein 804B isoform X1 [Amblyraja radiata]
MACYYLVISSTHLSNGHFRSIKGVFRGPLCKNGSETLDAGKEKAIAKALEDLKANFYCELCDKQYHKHQEFDNHINSYDHAHKQRLKELKQREFARNVASRSRKDEKKQEKALKRLHQLAELRKQSECAPGSGPMFRPATAAIGNHLKEAAGGSIAKGRENGRKGNTRTSFIRDEVLRRTQGNSVQCPPCGNQCIHGDSPSQIHGRLGLKPFSHFTKKNSPCIPFQKGSVSFSFYKKAPLKLESSASVFNDTLEEKQYEQEPQSHKVKATAEAEISEGSAGIDNTADTENIDRTKQSQMFSGTGSNPFARVKKLKALMLKENKDEAEKEYYCYSPTHCKRKTNVPFLFLMKSSEKADLDKVVAHSDNIGESQIDGSDVKCSTAPEIGNEKAGIADAKKMVAAHFNSPAHQQTNTQEGGNTLDQSVCRMKGEEPSGLNEKLTESILPEKGKLSRVEPLIRSHLKTEPFLPVLSRDESTRLQWPSELLLFTQTEPILSYSCNPLYFDFKLSRNKNRESGTTEWEDNKDCQQNPAITIEEDNGSGTTTGRKRSLVKEQGPNTGKSAGSHISKKRKNRNRSCKKLKQKSDPGHVRKKKKKRNGRKNTEAEPKDIEEILKEGNNSKLIPKRSSEAVHCSADEELEQVSSSVINKQSVPPFDLINKKLKAPSGGPLNISQESCEDQKAHKSKHDSLNSIDSDSAEEHHNKCRKSFPHCSYKDDSRSNRIACRKSRSYSSSPGSSLRSSSDTSSDHSRTSHRSRHYSDRSSDYSNRSRSQYCSKRHRRSHYQCHSRHKKKKHSHSSNSSLSSDDDHYHRTRGGSQSRNRGSALTRTQMSTTGQLHSRNRKSRSRQLHSRSRSRYRSRSRHGRSRQDSSRGSSLRRSCSRNKENCRQEISDEKLSKSFSKGSVYHIKSSHCNRDHHEVQRGTGKLHGTIKNEGTLQNYSPISPSLFHRNMNIGCSILPLKKLIQDKKESSIAKHILENGQCEDNDAKSVITESASSTMGLKLKDSPQGYFGPQLPISMDNVTLWSLIGKLSAPKKVGAKKDDISKEAEPEHSEWSGNESPSTSSHEESLLKEVNETKMDIEQSSLCNPIEAAEEEKIGLTIYQVQAAKESVTPDPEEMSNVVSSTADVFTDGSTAVKEKNPRMTFYDSSDISSVPLGEIMFDYYGTNSQSVDEMDPHFKESSKSISPPLASQPIIFLPEEVEKYSKLQLQAQQHIQQQLLAKQVKTFPPSAAAVTFTPVPAFQPISLHQPSASTASSVTTVHHTLLQHHAAASLTAALHPSAHHQAMAQLHHIAQPHITPFSFSPIAQAIFPAHPAAFLASHPLHFIPAATIHPAHLALHPLPHTALCPTLFAPHPAAAMAAASAIHLHPLLHPLFPGHDLQHRSGPST